MFEKGDMQILQLFKTVHLLRNCYCSIIIPAMKSVRAFWSAVAISSLEECMERIGTPRSRVLMQSWALSMEPRVLPPRISARLQKDL